MDKELQRYYEDRMNMMSTKAWSDLVEDIENMLHAANRVDGIESEKDLYFKKGEVSIMRWILTLKENSNLSYEQLRIEQ